MFIKQLHLKNYRNYEQLEVRLKIKSMSYLVKMRKEKQM